jgi:hypothetical protein
MISCGICRGLILNSDILQLPSSNGSLERKIVRQRKISHNNNSSQHQQQINNSSSSSSLNDRFTTNSSSSSSSLSDSSLRGSGRGRCYIKKNEAVASAGCGHLFHKRCLALQKQSASAIEIGSGLGGGICPACPTTRQFSQREAETDHDSNFQRGNK